MPKKGYKIILIKEGKYDLRQYDLSFVKILTTLGFFFTLLFLSFYLVSKQFSLWSSDVVVEKHRNNNKSLINSIEDNQKRINILLDELGNIKNQDDALRRLVKLPIIDNDIRKMGYGGVDEPSKANDFNYLLPNSNINLEKMNNDLDRLSRLIKLEILSYEELSTEFHKNKKNILSYPAIFPVDEGRERLSSKYGYRKDPFSRKHKFHDGHDFSAPIGTSVYSSASGRVKRSKYWGSFGNYIEIDHGNGYITAYGHLSSRNVRVGEKVLRGQKIGEVGNTGRSTAPHLHYEVILNKKSVDPIDYYFDVPMN